MRALDRRKMLRDLGVTEPGLRVLCKAVADGGTVKLGKGTRWSYMALPGLERRALVSRAGNDFVVTHKGRSVVADARGRGW